VTALALGQGQLAVDARQSFVEVAEMAFARHERLLALGELVQCLAQRRLGAGKAHLETRHHKLAIGGDTLVTHHFQAQCVVARARGQAVVDLDHRRPELRLQVDHLRQRGIELRLRAGVVGVQGAQGFGMCGIGGQMATKVGAVTRMRLLHPCEALFEPNLPDRMFGAQQVPVGQNLVHRQGRLHFEATHGEVHRATPQRRQDHQSQQSRNEDAEDEKHDLFNQTASRQAGTRAVWLF